VDTCDTLIAVPHAAISPALKARDHKGVSSDGDGDGDGAVFEEGDRTAPLTTGTDPSANIICGAMTKDVYSGGMGGRVDAAVQGYALPTYSTKLHNTASNQAGKLYEEYTVGLDSNSPPPALLTAMAVRRLTPMECERLQGFPDGYTAITNRNKPAADGPRYKALGNSWAVPNVRWIGERIKQIESINSQRKAA
jgi:hypothetical protein